MARGTWKEIVTRELRSVPKGSPMSEYRKAMQRASAIYRGSSPVLGNPSGDNLLAILAIAGLGYLAYQYIQQHPELLGRTAAQP